MRDATSALVFLALGPHRTLCGVRKCPLSGAWPVAAAATGGCAESARRARGERPKRAEHAEHAEHAVRAEVARGGPATRCDGVSFKTNTDFVVRAPKVIFCPAD